MNVESRAELKRAYKETPPETGVFVITNTKNGKVYLGSSLNLRGPLNRHRFMLNHGSNWVKGLQADWKLFGADAFTFEVVELVKRTEDPDFDVNEALQKLERAWLEKLQPIGERGYNKDAKIRE